MKKDILKLVKDKHTGDTGYGLKIYSNITEEDLNKIIAVSIISVVDKIQAKIDVASDEWNTISLIEQELNELKAEYGSNKKKKLKP